MAGGGRCVLDSLTLLTIRPHRLGLHLRSSLLYVRDPHHVVPPSLRTVAYEAGTSLPRAAVDSGLSSRYGRVWFLPRQALRAIYVKQGTQVDRWPRLTGGCV